MKYAIIYSSKTGNTKTIAEKIKVTLPKEECIYVGEISDQAQECVKEAEQIYVGFWTDKGSCDEQVADFLKSLQNKKIFLFGTAGFGGEQAYFERILTNVKQYIASNNEVVGTFMCQGKMPYTVRQRYEKMKETNAIPNADDMIANFDKALSHPDEDDFEHLKEIILK